MVNKMKSDSTLIEVNYNFNIGVYSDKGIRNENQDSYGILMLNQIPTFIIADGAGGYDFGKIASDISVKAFIGEIEKLKVKDSDYFKKLLKRKYDQINEYIYKHYEEKNIRMMSTVTQATILENQLIVSNVGDSILIRIRNGKVDELTERHSLAWEEYSEGIITYEQYMNHSKKNVITRAVGGRDTVKPFIGNYNVMKEDIYVMCTDGIYNYINNEEIVSYLNKDKISDDELNKICKEISNEALLRGSKDNVTILIFKVC